MTKKFEIEERHYEELLKKQQFIQELGLLCDKHNVGSVSYMNLELLYDDQGFMYEILKIVYRGGGFAVRNCSINSSLANLAEVASILYTSPYSSDKDWYQKFRDSLHEITEKNVIPNNKKYYY